MTIFKILARFKHIKKFIIGFYTNVWLFLFFGWLWLAFFAKLCEKHFCQGWINVPGKAFLRDLNKLTFVEKAVLHKNTPMHCKARQVLLDLCSTNQGNCSEITFVAKACKINLKDLKT